MVAGQRKASLTLH